MTKGDDVDLSLEEKRSLLVARALTLDDEEGIAKKDMLHVKTDLVFQTVKKLPKKERDKWKHHGILEIKSSSYASKRT
ncbi:hypothetical protein [Virgibacillus proomii]|uniref:hypothetical protein n=1 Tax=Virgibacillus proomii TaxID=84407 RepID=UPI001C1231CA|nr:hypothetical protein [Virgibacillus proomii]MBU5266941.1 hypothetical protein [Virgibacillus proomii]